MERRIAKVQSTTLGWEDHGILTCWLQLDYGHSSQGAGLRALDEPPGDGGSHRRGTAYGMEFVARLMRACGVRRWEDLPGRTVYAVIEDGYDGGVVGIEPLPTEPGEPFLFDELTSSAPSGTMAS